ncbi:MAG: protoporphyrinogen oxidase, partial [Candidatus Binataceae bacterium]
RAAARDRDAGGAAARGISGARWSLFLSFKGGMGILVDALAARLDGSIRFGARAIDLIPGGTGDHSEARPRSWTIRTASGGTFAADAVLCTLPAYAAAPLLRPHNRALADALAEITYASAATVNLAFRTVDFPNPPRSFGFVVPVAENRRIIAGSFSSLKFAGRAPAGMLLARVFLGGALQTEMMRLDDAAMIDAARAEFAALLGVTAAPMLAHLQRWADAMPQYAVGHLERAAAIEREAAALPAFALAGAFLRGVGIPDCISSGERAAEAMFSHIMPCTWMS